ncbi:hypothetical protein D033_4855, partial [Vibrio parahaemolyticus B-265]
MFNTSF